MNDVTRDIWARWRQTTRARIGLGRSGDALPTSALLDFQAAHGRARDAVHGAADFAALTQQFTPRPCLTVRSQAPDRTTYLRRPDLGRRLDDASAAMLKDHAGEWDIVFVIADGLSARAAMTHAAPVLHGCMARLRGWRVAPIVLATQARVALGDDIATCLNAKSVAVLIGERPGLSVADSLGIYLTWAPKPSRVDSERNCISNIHADGMSHDQAAATLLWLLHEAKRLQLSGIGLKLDPAGVAALLPGST